MRTIYIDADACPVTHIAEEIARRHGIPVTILCDTNHVMYSDYSTVKLIGAGTDAVDLALINIGLLIFLPILLNIATGTLSYLLYKRTSRGKSSA